MIPEEPYKPSITFSIESTVGHVLSALEGFTVGLELRDYVEEVDGYGPEVFEQVKIAHVLEEEVAVVESEHYAESGPEEETYVPFRDIKRVHVY